MQDLSGQKIKGYELHEQIGAGGFGAVYRAYQPLIKRDVAMKIILPEHANQPGFIRRFEYEAQLVARLEHIHIVALYDYWRDPAGAYLVMRWLRGGSLRQHLKRSGVIENEDAVRIVEQVTAALGAAHRRGIVHRDIKPDNILFDEEKNAYLADFGIAKDVTEVAVEEDDRPDEDEEALTGSPFYLSPEQAQSQPITAQADLYSMGIVIYELLTGKTPFSGEKGLMPLLMHHIQDPIPDVRELRPDLPEEVDVVLQRATAKDPLSRYQEANALAVDFRRALLKAAEAPAQTGPDIAMTIDGQPVGEESDDLLLITKPMTPATLIIVPPEEILNPYKGLQPFEEADVTDFFGREDLIEQLIERMKEPTAQGRFLAVIGPSGSGKSSVVKAGVIPALRQNALRNSDQWYMLEMKPGPDPFRELAAALLGVAINPPPNLLDKLRTDENALIETINSIVPDGSTSLLLTIDQFEEVFTLVESEDKRAHFLNLLQTAIADLNCPFRLIITLRADFFDRPLLYPQFGKLVRNRNEVVLPLAVDELRAAIVGPAERLGISVETGLVAAIVNEVGEQHGTLPLLQYALTELFERRDETLMTLDAYQETGGVLGALAQRAADLYAELNPTAQDVLRQMFLRMVNVGEGEDDTRRRVPQIELMGLVEDEDLVLDLIDQLSQARLLTTDRDPETRMPVVTVAHEALIREWDQYRTWLDDSREDLLLQRRVFQANAEWITHRHDDSFLVTGTRLHQFEELLTGDATIALTPEEIGYIESAVALREKRAAEERARAEREAQLEEQAKQRMQIIAVVLAVGIVIAGILAVIAFNNAQEASRQRDNAEEQKVIAEEQRDIASEQRDIAQREAEVNRSLLLVSTAQREVSNYNLDSALVCAIEANAIDNPPAEVQQMWFDVALAPGTERVFAGHTDAVRTGIFSPDGQFAISGGGDSDPTLIVWDVATGEILHQSAAEHTERISSLAISPDGTTVLSASFDDTLILWDATTLEVLATLGGHTDDILQVAISPDGTTALSASKDDTVILWDLAEQKQLHQFEDSELVMDEESGETSVTELGADEESNVTGVGSAIYTPDSTQALFGSEDGSLELWDLTSYELLRSYETQLEAVNWLAINTTGSTFLSSSRLGIVSWDIETPQSIGFAETGTNVATVIFSQDSQHFFSAGNDQTITVWNLGSMTEVTRFTGHEAFIGQLDLSPNGYHILSASNDNTLRLWTLRNGAEIVRLAGTNEYIAKLRTTPDSAFVVASALDGSLHVWDSTTREPITTLTMPAPALNAVPNADGSLILGVDFGYNLTVWDVSANAVKQELGPLDSDVYGIDLSQDGQFAIAGTFDGRVLIWDVSNGDMIQEFAEHDDAVWTVAFSPDGQRVLSGANNGTLLYWDAMTSEVIHTFAEFEGSVDNVVFSPDGQFGLATSGSTVTLWDLTAGELARSFVGHDGQVTGAVFNPAGDRIASSANDGTLRVWDAATGEQIRQLEHGDNLSSVLFSADGTTLISGAPDTTVRVWDATPLTLEGIRAWTANHRYVPTDETCLPAADGG